MKTTTFTLAIGALLLSAFTVAAQLTNGATYLPMQGVPTYWALQDDETNNMITATHIAGPNSYVHPQAPPLNYQQTLPYDSLDPLATTYGWHTGVAQYGGVIVRTVVDETNNLLNFGFFIGTGQSLLVTNTQRTGATITGDVTVNGQTYTLQIDTATNWVNVYNQGQTQNQPLMGLPLRTFTNDAAAFAWIGPSLTYKVTVTDPTNPATTTFTVDEYILGAQTLVPTT